MFGLKQTKDRGDRLALLNGRVRCGAEYFRRTSGRSSRVRLESESALATEADRSFGSRKGDGRSKIG